MLAQDHVERAASRRCKVPGSGARAWARKGPGEPGLVDAHLTSIVYFHSLAVPFGHIAKTVNVSGPL
jgi:hypothetical protein